MNYAANKFWVFIVIWCVFFRINYVWIFELSLCFAQLRILSNKFNATFFKISNWSIFFIIVHYIFHFLRIEFYILFLITFLILLFWRRVRVIVAKISIYDLFMQFFLNIKNIIQIWINITFLNRCLKFEIFILLTVRCPLFQNLFLNNHIFIIIWSLTG